MEDGCCWVLLVLNFYFLFFSSYFSYYLFTYVPPNFYALFRFSSSEVKLELPPNLRALSDISLDASSILTPVSFPPNLKALSSLSYFSDLPPVSKERIFFSTYFSSSLIILLGFFYAYVFSSLLTTFSTAWVCVEGGFGVSAGLVATGPVDCCFSAGFSSLPAGVGCVSAAVVSAGLAYFFLLGGIQKNKL